MNRKNDRKRENDEQQRKKETKIGELHEKKKIAKEYIF
jgi:hypothetical protein